MKTLVGLIYSHILQSVKIQSEESILISILSILLLLFKPLTPQISIVLTFFCKNQVAGNINGI